MVVASESTALDVTSVRCTGVTQQSMCSLVEQGTNLQ